MSDLISRKYLYNLMCEREEIARNRVLEAPTGSPKFGSCCARLTEITALKHDIADAPTVEAKSVEWIPCCERLPEPPVIGEDGYIVQQDNVIEPYSAYWDGQKWTDSCGDGCGNIIAWMPLPEPYKGE